MGTRSFIPAALVSRYAAAVFQGLLMMRRFYAIRLSLYAVNAVGLAILLAASNLTVWTAVATYVAGLASMAIVTFALARRTLKHARKRFVHLALKARDLFLYAAQTRVDVAVELCAQALFQFLTDHLLSSSVSDISFVQI